MCSADTLNIIGSSIQPSNTPIHITVTGHYWLPYLRKTPMYVGDALTSIIGKYVQVKSIYGTAFQAPLINSLNLLEPNKGYIINITDNNTVLIYPNN